jgi:hypothetical protein
LNVGVLLVLSMDVARNVLNVYHRKEVKEWNQRRKERAPSKLVSHLELSLQELNQCCHQVEPSLDDEEPILPGLLLVKVCVVLLPMACSAHQPCSTEHA